MNDTGLNRPESEATLLYQQRLLGEGKRAVQMFPKGTEELPLLPGFERTENERGVFHFNPEKITEKEILRLSAERKENLLLDLGPYNKADIVDRLKKGSKLVMVTEYTPEMVEARTAATTSCVLGELLGYFELTKGDKGNKVVIDVPPSRLKGQNDGTRN